MKKFYLFLGVLLACHTGVFAQMEQSRPANRTLALGIKGGVNMPRMLYFNNPALIQLPQSFVFTPTGGVFLDIPLSESLVFSPEVAYVQRGTDMNYVHQPSGAKVHYSIATHNVDLRLPLELVWKVKPYFQPFVTIGAEAGMCLAGQIHLDRTAPIELDETLAVDSANMAMIHAGAFAGVGVRSKVSIGYQDLLLKLNVTFHQGLLDSYSSYEKEGSADVVNVNAYHITGYRLPQGLEVSLGIAIPLKPRLKDACATFSNDRRRHSNRGNLFGY